MHRLALILVVTSACVASSGDEGFEIVHNLAPGDGCVIEPGGGFLARGMLDVTGGQPYLLTPEFQSRITAVEGTVAQRTIALRGARVSVSVLAGSVTLSKPQFTTRFAASLSPGGQSTAAFEILSIEDAAALMSQTFTTNAQLVAKVTAFGALGGTGDEIDAVPFEYPITLCSGCVLSVAGTCPLPAGTETGSPNSCNRFQDGSVVCCTEASGALTCPGRTM